jgi:hypothetical protein
MAADEERKLDRFITLAFVALSFATLAPIFRHPDSLGGMYDWRYFQSAIEVGRRSLVWFHQMPLWNPYACGGEVLLGNPQSEVATPTFLLSVLFGTALGVKLGLWLYLFCAFDGTYRLARHEKLDRASALFAAIIYGTCGWFSIRLANGQSNIGQATLFPYLLLFYRRGLDEWEWVLPLGAIAAWVIGMGGTNASAIAAVLLFTAGATDAIQKRSWRPFAILVGGALTCLFIDAIRILPTMQFVVDHPRHRPDKDGQNLFEIIRNGWWWRSLKPVGGHEYWFHEYGYKLPYVVIPFLLLALPLKAARRWWVIAAVGAVIAMGFRIPFGPWWLLRHLPFYGDLRVPSRYQIFLALAFALCAGVALMRHRERWRYLPHVVIAFAFLDGAAYAWDQYWKAFDFQVGIAARGEKFYQVRGDWRSMIQHIMANHGAIACDEEAPLQRAAELDEGDVPQARLLDPSAGELTAIRWTPNRIEADVALTKPTTIMFNGNWNEHWKSPSGKVVRVGDKNPMDRDGGRLGVEVDAGKQTVVVRYRPGSYLVGAAISALSIPLAIALWLVTRRRRRQSAGSSPPA